MDMLGKTGSVKRGIVSPDLQEERAKCNFDQRELGVFLHGGEENLQAWNQMMKMFGDDPELANSFEFYDMSPHEMHINLWERINTIVRKHKDKFVEIFSFKQSGISPSGYFQSGLPISLHLSMFRLVMENMANAE